MVKTTTACGLCGGRIEIVRDLADETGASELEEHHLPDCPATTRAGRDEALHLVDPAVLWTARRERDR